METNNGPLGLIRRLQQAELRLSAAALIALMLITCADVFMRYLFNRPIRGSYELVECLLLVFVFHGMAAAFFGRKNIVIDLVDTFVSARIVTFLVRLADVLSVICLGLIMWAMIVPTMQTYQYHDVKIETGLPVYWLWIVALAGLAVSALCALAVLFARPVAEPGIERAE